MEPHRTPNLPGYSFQDPRGQDFRRGQYMRMSAGVMQTRPPLISTLGKQLDEHSRSLTLPAPAMRTSETFATEQPFVDEDTPPVYGAVLRFYAYFRQAVTESSDEDERVRYVRIHVYLEDDTVMIEEYHVRNSGMEQGVLLRRMRALNAKASPYGTQFVAGDFAVGVSVEICGITYRIYACDKFTDDYLKSAGRAVARFEEPPDDLYAIKRTLTERPVRVGRIDTDKTHLRQFLEFDGKVLRFWALWDDSASLFGEKRNFVLHYFLVDETIEIRQILPQNSGRDPVSQFLKKTQLMNPQTGKPYADADLHIGAVVRVHGRDFLLYDADDFSKEFLDQKYGPHDWTPIDAVARQTRQKADRVVPPHNGWGNEQDSLGYCLSLHPKPPRRDLVKLDARQGQVLRFSARFREPAPQDRLRKFVIVYYLADDSLAVFELPQRNSGFREGKFIQRAQWKTRSGRFFEPADFRIGGQVVINGFDFLIESADEYALNLMEAESDDFPQANLAQTIGAISGNTKAIAKMRMQLEARDRAGKGYIDPKIAQQMIMRIFGIGEHAALTAVRRWENDWGFDYLGFLASIPQ
jgi:hypothetical protein